MTNSNINNQPLSHCIRTSYSALRSITQIFTDCHVPYDFIFFLLYHNTFLRKTYRKSVFIELITAGRTCIPTLWCHLEPPTMAQQFARIQDIKLTGDLMFTIRRHRGNLATELVLLVWISIHSRTHLLCSSVPGLGHPLTTRTGIHLIMRPIPPEPLPPAIPFPFFLDHWTPSFYVFNIQ